MTNEAKGSPRDFSRPATILIRVAFFAVALAMVGTYFLPWAMIDGIAEQQSGAELTTLMASPTLEYLLAVNPLQTIILIGCPIVVVLFSLIILVNYARGETHLLSTLAVLLTAIAFQLFTFDIVSNDGSPIGMGNLISIVLSTVLVVHYSAIRIHTKLYEKRKFPLVFRKLYFLTGNGFYRVSTDKRPLNSNR